MNIRSYITPIIEKSAVKVLVGSFKDYTPRAFFFFLNIVSVYNVQIVRF